VSTLDDVAAAALYRLTREPYEHVGLLYENGGAIERTPTRSQRSQGRASGRFEVPSGSLRALFHNHPPSSTEGAEFSARDMSNAQRLGVPSYITSGDRVRRFDPATGEAKDVLHQIPIDEWRRQLMIELLKRDPDDPRGVRR